jgi:hypothetical protein
MFTIHSPLGYLVLQCQVIRLEGASRYDSKYTVKTIEHPDCVIVFLAL